MTSILKVTEIQDPTNSNTALSIDSSGNLTAAQKLLYGPNQPMFSVRGRENASAISNLSLSNTSDESSTVYIDTWDVTEVDRGNLFNNGRLVAPVNGIYEINALSGQGNNAQYRALIVIKLDANGTSGEEIYRVWSYNDYNWYTLAYHGFLELTAGQQVAVGWHNGYTNHHTDSHEGGTLFSAKLIG
jgi:hypothetical protein